MEDGKGAGSDYHYRTTYEVADGRLENQTENSVYTVIVQSCLGKEKMQKRL